MLDLGRDNVSMFCKSSFAPPSFLRTDQPNRAQPSSLLWSEDRVCSCCVCFVCTKHPHTQWRVNLCWYEATWGLWLQEVQSKAWTHSLPPALCYISLSAPFLCFLGSLGGSVWFSPAKSILLAYSWATRWHSVEYCFYDASALLVTWCGWCSCFHSFIHPFSLAPKWKMNTCR